MKISKYSYISLSLALMLATMPVWGADGSLPATAESRSRAGNVQGSLIEGRLVTTYDGAKHEQDWYAVTLAQASTVGWVVFTHGAMSGSGRMNTSMSIHAAASSAAAATSNRRARTGISLTRWN